MYRARVPRDNQAELLIATRRQSKRHGQNTCDSRHDDSVASGRDADLRGTKWLLLLRPRPSEDLMGTMINPFRTTPTARRFGPCWSSATSMRFSPATGRWSKMISSPRAFSDCMRGSNRGPAIGSWRFQSSHAIATNGCDRRMRRRTSLMPSLCAQRDDAWKITSFVGYLRPLGEDNL